MSLPNDLSERLSLPLIAAPMLHVSGPELVIAACRSGTMGAFPTANAARGEGLDAWLARIQDSLGPRDAPCCPNIILHRPPEQLAADIAAMRRHRLQWVITSVGSPAAVTGPLHVLRAHRDTRLDGRNAAVLARAAREGSRQTGWNS
jgi:nitronate monooxygenase